MRWIFCVYSLKLGENLNERKTTKIWHWYCWRCALGNAYLPILWFKRRFSGHFDTLLQIRVGKQWVLPLITSQSLDVEDEKEAIRKAVLYFNSYLNKGQVEIIYHIYLHVTGIIYDSERVINYLIEKVNHALESGYSGLKLSENTFWL